MSDNCYAEFGYSLNRKGVERLIAVVMEPACRDPTQWQGAVGLRLGSTLYIDCSAEVGSAAFNAGVEALTAEVRKRVQPDESVPRTPLTLPTTNSTRPRIPLPHTPVPQVVSAQV